jgi:transcription initiation factor IIE alpha subunit
LKDNVTVYRCPRCHYTLDRQFLSGMGCRICGWVSPLADFARDGQVEVAYGEETVRVTMKLDTAQGF